MNTEIIRMNQRARGTPENLLCPLRRQMESGKLLFVRQAMQIKLEEAQLKKPGADYNEARQKVNLLIETEEYLRQVYELAYQCNVSAFRADNQIRLLLAEVDQLSQKIKQLEEQNEALIERATL